VQKPESIPALQTGKRLRASALYRRFLEARFKHFTLAGLISDDEPILLRQIYVPLVLTPEPVRDHVEEAELHKGGHDLAYWLVKTIEEEQGRIFNEDALGWNILFISGEAGSGKTTLIQSVITSLAGSASDDFNLHLDGYLPFPILLREAPIDELESLRDLLLWWMAQAKLHEPELVPEDVLAFLDADRGILLLDGLDELGTLERRKRVISWLHESHWTFAFDRRAPNLTVVTARPSGYEDLDKRPLTMIGRRLYLAPFSIGQIQAFLVRWFELRPLSPMRRAEHVQGFIERLAREPRMSRLRMLSRRPAYLTSLAFVHGTRGALPHTRAALYDSLIEAYIDTLDRQRGLANEPWDRQEKRDVLASVAFQAHTGATIGKRYTNEGERRFSWTRSELEQAVARAIQQGKARFRTIRPEDAKDLTSYYISRTGLLVESQEGRYQFGHLSIQEYLAAAFAIDRAAGSANKASSFEKLLLDRLDNAGWTEVALLALAIDSTRTYGTGHRALLARLDPAKEAHIEFLALILAGEELPLEHDERYAWVAAWLLRALARPTGRVTTHYGFISLGINQEPVNAVWSVVCDALASGMSPVAAVRRIVLDVARAGSVAASDHLSDLDVADDVGALDAPIDWVNADLSPLNEEQFGADVIATLYSRESVHADLTSKLVQVADTVPLFSSSSTLPSISLPTSTWFALNLWEYRVPGLRQVIRPRTPLSWICADDSNEWPVTVESRWNPGASEIEQWRRDAWRMTLDVERMLYAAVLRVLSADISGGSTQSAVVELVKRSARVWSGVRSWEEKHPAPHLSYHGKDSGNVADTLEEVRRMTWELVEKPRAASTRLLGRISEGSARGVLISLSKAWERLEGDINWGGRCVALIIGKLTMPLLSSILGERGPNIRRNEVIGLQERLMDADYITRNLRVAATRAQARTEYRDLLASPLSPLPVLDAILAADWELLDVSTAATTANFERVGRALLKEAGLDPDASEVKNEPS
jgi:hypothetical protein